MARSTHHGDYQNLLDLLRAMREEAGVTQSDLGARLQNTQTFVSKVERGERRIDLVEFVEICEALGCDPITMMKRFMDSSVRRGKTSASKLAARRRA